MNAVMAVGVTILIITGGIDLSVGSVAALAGVLGVILMADFGFNPLVGILGGIAVGAIAGLVNGLLVSVVGLPPFIATLGMLSVGRGLVLIVTGAVACSARTRSGCWARGHRRAAIPVLIIAWWRSRGTSCGGPGSQARVHGGRHEAAASVCRFAATPAVPFRGAGRWAA